MAEEKVIFGRIVKVSPDEITVLYNGEYITFNLENSSFQKGDVLKIVFQKGEIKEVKKLTHFPKIFSLHQDVAVLKRNQLVRNRVEEIIDRFFSDKDFFKVDVPYLVPSAGNDSWTDPFRIEGVGELHTSPEFSLKKIIAAGFDRIYSLVRVFRDDPPTLWHQREFSMLEFYETWSDYKRNFSLTKELLERIWGEFWSNGIIEKNGRKYNFLKFEEIKLDDLFAELAGFRFSDFYDLLEFKKKVAYDLKLNVESYNSWNDVFSLVFIEKIEPFLKTRDYPVALFDFPLYQRTLEEVSCEGKYAMRYEIIFGGVELCNGFQETQKLESFWDNVTPDHDLQEAINSSFPPCSGNAVGIDRVLYFASPYAQRLSDLYFFPSS